MNAKITNHRQFHEYKTYWVRGVNISVVETIIYDSQPQIKRGHKEELLNFDYGIHLRLISVIIPFSIVTRVFSWKKSGLLSFNFSM